MFRIIRWLCFPIARRLGVWPIGVYFALLIPLAVLRRTIWASPQADLYVPAWLFPALYAFLFVGFPLLVWIRNRDWYRKPVRD